MNEAVLRRVVRLIGAGATFAMLAAHARVETLDMMAFVAGEEVDQRVIGRIDRATAKLAPAET